MSRNVGRRRWLHAAADTYIVLFVGLIYGMKPRPGFSRTQRVTVKGCSIMVKQPTYEELERMREEYRRWMDKNERLSRMIAVSDAEQEDAARRQRPDDTVC